MKNFIGRVIATIGAKLWAKGGWTGDESYEDLKVTGKIGYKMFCLGLSMMGVTQEILERFIDERIFND